MMAGIPPATDAPIFEALPRLASQIHQFRPALGDQKFVRRDHATCRPRSAFRIQSPAGFDASHQLHENVGVRGEHFVDALGPAHARGHPVHFLPAHIAIENVRQLKRVVRFLAEQFGNRAADGAEAGNRNLQLLWERFFAGAGLLLDLDFERFGFAANASPRWNMVSNIAFP